MNDQSGEGRLTVALDIVLALGGTWIIVPTSNGRWSDTIEISDGIDVVDLHFYKQSHKPRVRLTVATPKDLHQFFNHRDRIELTVAEDRKATEVARKITKELLPPHRVLIEKALDERDKYNEKLRRLAKAVADLKELAPGIINDSQLHSSSDWGYKRKVHSRASGVGIDGEVTAGDYQWTLKIDNLRQDEAEAVMYTVNVIIQSRLEQSDSALKAAVEEIASTMLIKMRRRSAWYGQDPFTSADEARAMLNDHTYSAIEGFDFKRQVIDYIEARGFNIDYPVYCSNCEGNHASTECSALIIRPRTEIACVSKNNKLQIVQRKNHLGIASSDQQTKPGQLAA